MYFPKDFLWGGAMHAHRQTADLMRAERDWIHRTADFLIRNGISIQSTM